MSSGPDQPISAVLAWAQDWQRLSVSATNQAMTHYLVGCANVAMARTPQQALGEVQKTQVALLGHSVDTFAAATKLWFK